MPYGHGTHVALPTKGQLKGSKETGSSCRGRLSWSTAGASNLTQRLKCGPESQTHRGLGVSRGAWAPLAFSLRLWNSSPSLNKKKRKVAFLGT